MSLEDSKKTLVTFLKEVGTGSLIFFIVAAAAVIVGFFLEALKATGTDPVVLAGLYSAKYLLFAGDLILFARFMFITVSKTWKALV